MRQGRPASARFRATARRASNRVGPIASLVDEVFERAEEAVADFCAVFAAPGLPAWARPSSASAAPTERASAQSAAARVAAMKRSFCILI